MRKPFLGIIGIVTVALILLAAQVFRSDHDPGGTVTLNDRGQSVDLRSGFLYLPDMGQSPDAVIAALRSGAMLPTMAEADERVVPYQAVWAITAYANTGETQRTLQIASRIHNVVGLEILHVDAAGQSETLLDYSARAAFDAGKFTGPVLTSRPFQVQPGQGGFLLAAIKRGPVATAALFLETPDRIASRAVRATAMLTAFYAVSLASLAFFLIFTLAMGGRGAVGYVVLLLLGLAFVAYMDGLTVRFLYPGQPDLHLPFGITLIFVLCAAGFFVAGHGPRVSGVNSPLLSRALTAGWVASLGCIVLGFVVAPEIMANVAYVFIVLMLAGQFASARLTRPVRGMVPVPVAALSTFCVSAMLAMVLLFFLGHLDGALDPGVMIRAFYASVAIWIMPAVARGLSEFGRQHAVALQNENAALKQAAETAEALLEAEQNYSRARDLARQRSRQLAAASHDLKQPIMSLRMTMDSMTMDADAAVKARLSDAFDYIEGLSQGYLEETADEDAPAQDDVPAIEAFDIGLILQTVGQMFGEEAAARGLDLRIVPTSLVARAPTLAVMRIVSNLVSNAVKYTGQGGVLVGARPRADRVEIWVADTGPGMTAQELSRYSQSRQKGAVSEGSGLGLSICHEIARENGMDLIARSRPGYGTVFRLSLPAGPPAVSRRRS